MVPPARSQLLVRAAGLACALLGCAQNPAYEGSGELPGTSSTGPDPITATTGPGSACPDGQDPAAWYPDLDADSYGDRKAEPVLACDAPEGQVADHTDCNDLVPEIHPMLPEQCNGLDDNCNQLVDESSADCGACTVELTKSFVYWFCPEKQPITWAEAAERCTALSFKNAVRLASIHSAAEQQFVIDRLGIIDPVEGERHVWIGLVKQDAAADTCESDPLTDWRWIDGTPFDLDPPLWSPGEPNNEMCVAGEGPFENCGELKLSGPTAGWNDVPCDAPGRGYVCRTKRDLVLFPD